MFDKSQEQSSALSCDSSYRLLVYRIATAEAMGQIGACKAS